jgi:hypothetical protein
MTTTMPQNRDKPPVQNANTRYDVKSIIYGKIESGKSLRSIANEYGEPVTHMDIKRLKEGIEPKNPDKRKALGYQDYAQVIPVQGEVPPGAQVIGARQCGCGKWFIANSGKRAKCYECTKPRKRK